MNSITQFVQHHMILVFFIYGLSFFLLGTAVSFQSRKGTGFRIGRHLWLLAGFGLLHGPHEWLDMFLMLGGSFWTPAGIRIIEIIRFFVGLISYIFLLQFGIGLLSDGGRTTPRLPLFALIGSGAAALFMLLGGIRSGFDEIWFARSDLTMRYLLAFPGAALAAVAFFREYASEEIRKLDAPAVSMGLRGLAVSFAAYALLAGLIVKDGAFFPASLLNYGNFLRITGLPVQFFRACSAIAMVIFLSRVLSIFELETKHLLETAYREIMRISNREHMRIGQDLHDGLGQQLAGTAYMAKALEKRLKSVAPEEGKTARQISDLLDRSIDITRKLSRGLYPVSLEENGLGFALNELAESTEQLFHVTCTSEIDAKVSIRNHEMALHLFRLTQEAVSNAAKHAGATHIRIRLSGRNDRIELTITDDGKGLKPGRIDAEGLGSRTMRYRAGVLRADLTIRPAERGGTDVICSLSGEAAHRLRKGAE